MTPSGSTLPLLMLRILAKDANHPFALNYLALITNLLNRCSNFHSPFPSLRSHHPGPRPALTPPRDTVRDNQGEVLQQAGHALRGPYQSTFSPNTRR